MADFLLITRADGGLSILQMLEGVDFQAELAQWELQADAEWLPVVSTRVATDPTLPTDRTNRNVWVDTGTEIVVDQNRVSMLAAAIYAELKQDAQALFADAKNYLRRVLVAEALVLMDEINLLRDRLTAQDAAIASATSLADLKSRWATLAAAQPMPDRTAAQAKTAIGNKIDSSESD